MKATREKKRVAGPLNNARLDWHAEPRSLAESRPFEAVLGTTVRTQVFALTNDVARLRL